MSWDQLEIELAEMFDEYSWRADDLQRALEIRQSQQNYVSAVRSQWQQSKIYQALKRESRRRYLAKHKPWRKPERREYMRKYRAEKRSSGEVRAAEAARARRWREKNKQRWSEYMREWRAANRDRENERQRRARAANREQVNAKQRERYRRMKVAA